MVAINNNLNEKFKIHTSKNAFDQNDELFAELFALMNSNVISSEEKAVFQDIVSESNENSSAKKLLDSSQINRTNNFSETSVNENELALAKSLAAIFYKELGIDENSQVPNKIKELSLKENFNIKSDLRKNDVNNKEMISNVKDLHKSLDLFEKKKIEDRSLNNLIIKIEKKVFDNSKKQHHEVQIGSSLDIKSNKPINKEPKLNISKNEKILNVSLNSAQVEKKIKKKNKQFGQSSKNVLEDIKTQINEAKVGIKTARVNNIKTQTLRDNKISIKKESFEKNDTKTLDNKQTLANPNNKEFLNLLESSWGEKFSRIIKNSVNNGVNKVEIELKPHNLGKLNLEVSLKNNKTLINISSENQEVVNILNENLPRFTEMIDKENKSFSSFVNTNNQNGNFGENKEKKTLISQDNLIKKKKNSESKINKISNHNIDVNA